MEKGTRVILKGEKEKDIEKATAHLKQLIHESEIGYKQED